MSDAAWKKMGAVVIFVGVTLGFTLGGLTLNNLFVQSRNKAQLSQMSSQLLSRAELAVDYAVITLGDLIAAGVETCGNDAAELLRQSIARRGAIKNILVADELGNVQCSGLPTGERIVTEDLHKSFPSRNQAIVLRKEDGEPNGMFQVIWELGSNDRFVATLNVDMLLFDVFPPEIRDRAQALISLEDTTEVAAFRTASPVGDAIDPMFFETKSDRFPISVRLQVDASDVASWNDQTRSLAAAIAGLLGIIVAILIIKLISRPPSEVETLRSAIRRGEIQPYFQPVFALDDMKIVGCEVLVRWIRNGAIVSSPDRFIPLAENSRLIVQLTDSVMTDALLKLRPLLEKDKAFKVAFNITPHHFVSDGFLQWLCNKLEGLGVSHSNVVLELTERQAFVDTKKATASATAARQAGFRISLDDTGSGHNGLGHVQELPVDIIKIDKKFVDLVDRDLTASSIVKMLVALANELGMTTVAEGVETQDQVQTLRQIGVSEGQGYVVSPAVPADRFLAMVEAASAAIPLRLPPPTNVAA